jgi:hypothetical protein
MPKSSPKDLVNAKKYKKKLLRMFRDLLELKSVLLLLSWAVLLLKKLLNSVVNSLHLTNGFILISSIHYLKVKLIEQILTTDMVT